MSLAPGESLGPYRIVRPQGKGGMGEVYLAEDTRLRRHVAVKVLPPELLDEPERRHRFLREARAAAAVDHPNIVHVYEVEEDASGRIYLVMQYVEGKTLRELLQAEKLDLDQVMSVGMEVADALAAAHGKGIVHRDIKPDNIMIDENGHARVLDFGLARALEPDAAPGSLSEIETMTHVATGAGKVMGTAAYMSPEQARGDVVDARSDIFSLGITLYEAVGGRHPFAGRTGVETVDSLLHAEPKPLAELRRGLPVELDWVLSRALAKKREERYQSAKDLLVDLKRLRRTSSASGAVPAAPQPASRWGRSAIVFGAIGVLAVAALIMLGVARSRMGPTPAPPGSGAAAEAPGPAAARGGAAPAGAASAKPAALQLAVLPFQNVRHDQRVDFLGFALADALISKLSLLDDVTVRPSSFVQKYRDHPPEDPKEAGRELGVSHLLTGSLLSQGDDLRISVQFVDLNEGAVKWQETVDSKLDNLLSVQDEVVAKIVDGLQLNLSDDERARLGRDRPKDSEAFDLYLRAAAEPRTAEGNAEALKLLNELLVRDASFAPAWEARANVRYQLDQTKGVGVDYAAVEKDVMKALELNPDLTSAYKTLAVVLTETNRAEEAYTKIKGWLASHPTSGDVHFALAYVYRYTGMLDEAATELERALALQPGNPGLRSGGMAYLYRGDYDDAKRFFSLDPNSGFYMRTENLVEYLQGDVPAAGALLDRLAKIVPDPSMAEFVRAQKLAYEGKKAQARPVLESLAEDAAGGASADAEDSYHIAATLALAGSRAPALKLLERAVRRGFYCYSFFERDPRLDSLRGLPEFRKILDEAKRRHEAFKAFVAANP